MENAQSATGIIAVDANGTLFNDTEQFLGALNDIYVAFGEKPRSRDWLTANFMVKRGSTWTDIFRPEIKASDTELYAAYRTAYEARVAADPPSLATGASRALRDARRRNYYTLVLSTQENAITYPLLERVAGPHASGMFDQMRGGVSDKGAVLGEACAALGVLRSNAFLIGDQISDAASARAAGAQFIHREGGVHTWEQINRALRRRSSTMRDFTDLPAILGLAAPELS
jgi:phosphoglycolate phosphatase-like HAD superfamily hydrolase